MFPLFQVANWYGIGQEAVNRNCRLVGLDSDDDIGSGISAQLAEQNVRLEQQTEDDY